MVQLALAASVPGQLLVCAKSPLFVPASPILLIVRAEVPLFVRVIVFAVLVVPTFWLPKLRLVGLRLTAGASTLPVPLSARFCGLSGALSVKVTLALFVPVAPGVKVTLMVQDAPLLSVLGQLLVCAKSPAFVPLRAILLIFKGALPLFLSVTVCGALVVPTTWLPKLKLPGFKLTAGAGET